MYSAKNPHKKLPEGRSFHAVETVQAHKDVNGSIHEQFVDALKVNQAEAIDALAWLPPDLDGNEMNFRPGNWIVRNWEKLKEIMQDGV